MVDLTEVSEEDANLVIAEIDADFPILFCEAFVYKSAPAPKGTGAAAADAWKNRLAAYASSSSKDNISLAKFDVRHVPEDKAAALTFHQDLQRRVEQLGLQYKQYSPALEKHFLSLQNSPAYVHTAL